MQDIMRRITRLKEYFEKFPVCVKYSEYKLDNLTPQEACGLSSMSGLPDDYWHILLHLGKMTHWSLNDAYKILWWMPMEIDEAMRHDLCLYRFPEHIFRHGKYLRLFAWDCDARVYFYDIRSSPWTLLSADGLHAEHAGNASQSGEPYSTGNLCAVVEERDFLRIVEQWACIN
jgi:hypothetical protein